MWKIIISVINNNTANGTISASFRKYLITVPEKREIRRLQKPAMLGAAHTSESNNVTIRGFGHGK